MDRWANLHDQSLHDLREVQRQTQEISNSAVDKLREAHEFAAQVHALRIEAGRTQESRFAAVSAVANSNHQRIAEEVAKLETAKAELASVVNDIKAQGIAEEVANLRTAKAELVTVVKDLKAEHVAFDELQLEWSGAAAAAETALRDTSTEVLAQAETASRGVLGSAGAKLQEVSETSKGMLAEAAKDLRRLLGCVDEEVGAGETEGQWVGLPMLHRQLTDLAKEVKAAVQAADGHRAEIEGKDALCEAKTAENKLLSKEIAQLKAQAAEKRPLEQDADVGPGAKRLRTAEPTQAPPSPPDLWEMLT